MMKGELTLDGEYYPAQPNEDEMFLKDPIHEAGTRYTSPEGMTALNTLLLKANLTTAMDIIETQKAALDVAETSMQLEVDTQEKVIAAMMAEQEAIRQANILLETHNESLIGLIDDVENNQSQVLSISEELSDVEKKLAEEREKNKLQAAIATGVGGAILIIVLVIVMAVLLD